MRIVGQQLEVRTSPTSVRFGPGRLGRRLICLGHYLPVNQIKDK
ncbi:hypothetical protein [Streptomyces canus]